LGQLCASRSPFFATHDQGVGQQQAPDLPSPTGYLDSEHERTIHLRSAAPPHFSWKERRNCSVFQPAPHSGDLNVHRNQKCSYQCRFSYLPCIWLATINADSLNTSAQMYTLRKSSQVSTPPDIVIHVSFDEDPEFGSKSKSSPSKPLPLLVCEYIICFPFSGRFPSIP
jgi:hypothetical protein